MPELPPMPSTANLVAGLLFGSIGFVAFIYGRKQKVLKPALLGIALMAYPYFVTQTLALYGVGSALTAALYFFRD